MNKKFLVLFVFLMIISITFVSAQGENSLKSAFDYSDANFLTLEKVWVGDNESVRPDSIDVDVIADGQLLETITLSKSNNWNYNGRVLFPINDTDGHAVTYTFSEHGADDYSLSYSKNGVLDYTLENTYVSNNKNQTNTTSNATSPGNTSSNTTQNDDFVNVGSGSSSGQASSDDDAVYKDSNPHEKNKTSFHQMKETGNAIWVLVVCIVAIVAVVVYKKR